MNQPYRAALLILSDRVFAEERVDLAGPELARELQSRGWNVEEPVILPDDRDQIAEWLKSVAEAGVCDVIFTSGGTGLGLRDVTPEATLDVIERRVPGIEEVMRRESVKITPHGMLSRGVCGAAGATLIVNLPGSPKGALENLGFILTALPHAIELLRGEHPDP